MTNRITRWQIPAVALLAALSAGWVSAQTLPPCPEAPNHVKVQVSVDVRFDSGSGLFTYTYMLSSDPTSAQEVNRFALEVVEPVSALKAPPGWIVRRFRGRPVVGWAAIEVADPDTVPDNASVPPSIAQIKPGASLGGFSLQSPKPPGSARYFVTGFVPLPVSSGVDDAEAELNAETLAEACPDSQKPVLDQALVGNTSGPANVSARTLTELSPAHLWIGLKNSDDQGTQFDLKAELLKNGAPVASGLARCITGVTRNPAAAKEAVVSFDPFSVVPVATGDVLALRVSARIGTNPDGSKCAGPGGSHGSALGLRLYYDTASRTSRFDATITPSPSENLYLHSDGGPCPSGGGQSPGVTARTLDTTAPAAASAKCKDSSVVNFTGGNPLSAIGTWSLAPLP